MAQTVTSKILDSASIDLMILVDTCKILISACKLNLIKFVGTCKILISAC